MMNRKQSRLFLAFLILIVTALMALPLAAQADDELAAVQFVHVLPGAGPVDVYVDGELTLIGLTIGVPSLSVQMSAGTHSVAVTQTGVTTTLWQQDITLAPGTVTTEVVSSTEPLEFTTFQVDVSPLEPGETRITGIHAIAGGPTVDVVQADGSAAMPGLQYNTPFGTLDVPAGVYELAVVPQGGTVDSALIPVTPIALSGATSHQIIAYGTASLPNLVVVSTPAQSSAESAHLRLAHAVPAGPIVDFYLDGVLVAPALEFGATTVFLPLPAGDHEAALVPSGEDLANAITTFDLGLEAGEYMTAAVVPDGESVAVQSSTVDASTFNSDSAVVEVLNFSSVDLVSTLADATEVVDAPAGGVSSASLDAANQNVALNAEGTPVFTAAGPLMGGALYTFVVAETADGPQVIPLPGVGFATTVGSAPGDHSLNASLEQTPTVTPAPTEAPAAGETPAPTEVAPVATEEAATQPTTAAAGDLPTARVLTDPGVNVHLRQFPTSIALSLSLLGSGTVVDVFGRPGERSLPPDVTPTAMPEGTPEPTPFVDPATLLTSPGDDLEPAETWLFVSYLAPDGGTITGWINALFLSVTATNGQPQRLADLPLVPVNRAGEANSSFVPTLAPTQPFTNVVVATVDQLAPGSNLHLRRNPNPAAESLALIPAGTQVVVEGVNDTGEWYRTTFNGVSGWISATYVSLSFNGVRYDPLNLQVLATPTPTSTPEPTPAS